MLTGTNLQYAKSYNVRIVLETIRLYGPLSRVEIARRTELTAQTVTNITRNLLKSGLILEADRIQEGRGAPSILLQINSDGAFSIGLDLDKDHLTAILMDLRGNIRQRISYELNFPSSEEALVLLDRTAKELIERERVSKEKVWGVGVGLPGPLAVSKGGIVTDIANPIALPGWHNVPVRDILSERLSLPVYLQNNASAAAIGELWYGAGRNMGTFFYVFFGAGLGGGVVMHGQPYSGHTGNAGELGYYPAQSVPENSLNIQNPHLGLHFNIPNLYKSLQMKGYPASKPADLDVLYRERNEHMVSWVENGAQQLAPLILAIEYLLDPKAIFFGGRIPGSIIGDLLHKLETILPTLRIAEKITAPQLLIATSGMDAAALGVATLPVYESLAPLPNIMMKSSRNSYRPLVPPAMIQT
jgi:predicted NBD/HSP70 family sugar kinase